MRTGNKIVQRKSALSRNSSCHRHTCRNSAENAGVRGYMAAAARIIKRVQNPLRPRDYLAVRVSGARPGHTCMHRTCFHRSAR